VNNIKDRHLVAEALAEAVRRSVSAEQMITELRAAGWRPMTRTIWKSPSGRLREEARA